MILRRRSSLESFHSLVWLAIVVTLGTTQPPASGNTVSAFEEVPANASGIVWAHDNAMSPQRYLPETVGAGCAFFDYDNDGWMDVYFVNSGPSDFFVPNLPLKNALYRNNHDGTFSDVTDKARVPGSGFGMGVAAADYDNDGWQDLYITNYGRNQLYHNNGDGTFTEVAERAGVSASGWTTCALWFDYDNDRRLDLFVSSFVHFNKALNRLCFDEALKHTYYCIPRLFKPTSSFLFHNNGDGTFRDVSRESGIADTTGKAFGVVATDVNNDGLMDLFVGNDTVANFLFLNKGKGTFEEIGLWAGVAYSEAGSPRSGMGVDAIDYDGDGWQDLFVANVDHESFSLYRNQKTLTFADESAEIGRATRMLSGWGLRFFDYDNDGTPDLFLANGHPDDMVEKRARQVTYKERLLLFQNVGGIFRNVSHQSGPVFQKEFPARGMATGDFDNDGDLDVIVANNGQAPLLLRNNAGDANHWLGLQLVGVESNPAGVGALITWQSAAVKRSRLKTAGGSYLSSHDPRELLGVGKATQVDVVEIRWPSGKVDKLTQVPVNAYIKVVEGKGVAAMTSSGKP